MRDLSSSDLTQIRVDYETDGFAYVRDLLTADELAPLAAALDEGGASPGGFTVPDSTGARQELSAWLDLGDDFVGIVPRLTPIVDAVTTVVGEPVYHWHSKLSWKRPGSDARWDWHQDYGFWADEGVARPDMCTIAIAVGTVDEKNGCLRLVRESHALGRIDVVAVGPTRTTDPDAVARVLRSHEVELCELESGDAVIFHGNTLHGSGPNHSDRPRTMLMSSYNAVSNPPSAPLHPGHGVSPLVPVPTAAVLDGWSEVFGDSAFLDPNESGVDYDYEITRVDR